MLRAHNKTILSHVWLSLPCPCRGHLPTVTQLPVDSTPVPVLPHRYEPLLPCNPRAGWCESGFTGRGAQDYYLVLFPFCTCSKQGLASNQDSLPCYPHLAKPHLAVENQPWMDNVYSPGKNPGKNAGAQYSSTALQLQQLLPVLGAVS